MAQRRPPVRRTTRPDGQTRDPILPFEGYSVKGREDRYIDPYFGTEYPSGSWPEGPLEVMTRTYETVFSEIGPQSPRTVASLLDKDPELLDFALGSAVRYDPL